MGIKEKKVDLKVTKNDNKGKKRLSMITNSALEQYRRAITPYFSGGLFREHICELNKLLEQELFQCQKDLRCDFSLNLLV